MRGRWPDRLPNTSRMSRWPPKEGPCGCSRWNSVRLTRPRTVLQLPARASTGTHTPLSSGWRHGDMIVVSPATDCSSPMTHVLVVDDVQAMAEQYAYDLKRVGGYTTMVAGGVDEAYDVLGREPIDCVVLDLEMPGADGFDLLRRLK